MILLPPEFIAALLPSNDILQNNYNFVETRHEPLYEPATLLHRLLCPKGISHNSFEAYFVTLL